jgi:hypothetical protein
LHDDNKVVDPNRPTPQPQGINKNTDSDAESGFFEGGSKKLKESNSRNKLNEHYSKETLKKDKSKNKLGKGKKKKKKKRGNEHRTLIDNIELDADNLLAQVDMFLNNDVLDLEKSKQLIKDNKEGKLAIKAESKPTHVPKQESIISMISAQKRKMSIAHNQVLDPNKLAGQENILSPPKLNKFQTRARKKGGDDDISRKVSGLSRMTSVISVKKLNRKDPEDRRAS